MRVGLLCPLSISRNVLVAYVTITLACLAIIYRGGVHFYSYILPNVVCHGTEMDIKLVVQDVMHFYKQEYDTLEIITDVPLIIRPIAYLAYIVT